MRGYFKYGHRKGRLPWTGDVSGIVDQRPGLQLKDTFFGIRVIVAERPGCLGMFVGVNGEGDRSAIVKVFEGWNAANRSLLHHTVTFLHSPKHRRVIGE